MARKIELVQQCLAKGTESVRQLPVEKIKDTAENALNIVPAISREAKAIGSLLDGAFQALDKDLGPTKAQAEEDLFDSKQAFEYVVLPGEHDAPLPQADELGRRYYGFSSDVLELIGQPGQLGLHQDLVAPLVKIREHLRELLEAADRYEAARNNILDQADQAQAARALTIEQADRISGEL